MSQSCDTALSRVRGMEGSRLDPVRVHCRGNTRSWSAPGRSRLAAERTTPAVEAIRAVQEGIGRRCRSRATGGRSAGGPPQGTASPRGTRGEERPRSSERTSRSQGPASRRPSGWRRHLWSALQHSEPLPRPRPLAASSEQHHFCRLHLQWDSTSSGVVRDLPTRLWMTALYNISTLDPLSVRPDVSSPAWALLLYIPGSCFNTSVFCKGSEEVACFESCRFAELALGCTLLPSWHKAPCSVQCRCAWPALAGQGIQWAESFLCQQFSRIRCVVLHVLVLS